MLDLGLQLLDTLGERSPLRAQAHRALHLAAPVQRRAGLLAGLVGLLLGILRLDMDAPSRLCLDACLVKLSFYLLEFRLRGSECLRGGGVTLERIREPISLTLLSRLLLLELLDGLAEVPDLLYLLGEALLLTFVLIALRPEIIERRADAAQLGLMLLRGVVALSEFGGLCPALLDLVPADGQR